MKKTLSSSLLFLLLAVPVWAQPPLVPAVVQPSLQPILAPQQAIDQSPAIVPLGSAVDPATGKAVEGIAFIHFKKAPGHKPQHGAKGGTAGSTCFSHLAKGARWKVTEQYILDPTNADGLTNADVATRTSDGLEAWDAEVPFDVFGTRNLAGVVDGADTAAPDGKNEIFFGGISDPGVIAVTIVWGIFAGPPSGRELVEFDMVFDDPDFVWGNAGPTNEAALGDTSVMDYWNVFTHEAGHAAGMGHPSDSCTEETEYRFSQNGETKKRTLSPLGDIPGIQALYP